MYGPRVSVIKSNLDIYLDAQKGKEKNIEKTAVLYSPLSGKLVPLEEVPDEAFSGKVLGDGVAILPSEGVLYSPCDGVVDNIFDTKHAVSIMSDDGLEILLHIGVDTVNLAGKHFTAHVKSKDRVRKGDRLISFDIKKIEKEGYSIITPVVVCNSSEFGKINIVSGKNVSAGEELLSAE